MVTLIKNEQRRLCHDCGVEPGKHHEPGCDTERCPKCKGQLISCGCFVKRNRGRESFDEEYFAEFEQDTWTGIMYEAEMKICEEQDLWTKLVPGRGWVKTTIDDPEASHDINQGAVILQTEHQQKK